VTARAGRNVPGVRRSASAVSRYTATRAPGPGRSLWPDARQEPPGLGCAASRTPTAPAGRAPARSWTRPRPQNPASYPGGKEQTPAHPKSGNHGPKAPSNERLPSPTDTGEAVTRACAKHRGNHKEGW